VISFPASVRVYLCTVPCDMRRSFDGLQGLVTSVMQLDALAGHLFVFSNRNRDRVKVLYWDRDGFAIWSKRLEEGTYAMPFGKAGGQHCELSAQELSALLSTHRSESRPAPEALSAGAIRSRIDMARNVQFVLCWERQRTYNPVSAS